MARWKRGLGIGLILLLGASFALTGCANTAGTPVDSAAPTAAPAVEATAEIAPESTPEAAEPAEITVLAAASLTEAFTEIAESFEAEHQGMTVTLSFAGSQECVAQIEGGVAADIFASANTSYMDTVVEEGYADPTDPVVFASNKLIAVCNKSLDPAPAFESLADGELMLVIADKTVPVGKYTLTMLDNVTAAGALPDYAEKFMDAVVSKETNVKLVLSKVELGEADCGIVYTSDAVSADPEAVYTVEVPDEYNVVATYPIAMLKDSPQPEAAQLFLDYILSDKGSEILLKYGLSKPE